MDLKAFLKGNAVEQENVKFIASKRFVGEDKEPMEWEIKAITSQKAEDLQKACTRNIPVPGRKGQFTKDVDYGAYAAKLAVECTVFPNLNDKELQDSYKVMGGEALLKTMLLPGEYTDYLDKVQEINGFGKDINDLVDEAKN